MGRITKTIVRRLFREDQEKVFTQVHNMAQLRDSCTAIIRYVYEVSPMCHFNEETEWVLREDNWIALRFTFRRWEKLTITLGAPVSTKRTDIEVLDGPYPNWRRVLLEKNAQLPSILSLVEAAYIQTTNSVRKRLGTPEIIDGRLMIPASYSREYDEIIDGRFKRANSSEPAPAGVVAH